MNEIANHLSEIRREIGDQVMLVAVSKNQPVGAILEAYQWGQRIFGENKVQEILAKKPWLPTDIQWHVIGHLQTNKVKYIAPFITMIQSVDSLRLLSEVSLQAQKNDRVIDCLLQIFIASEETKFGLDKQEVRELLTAIAQNPMPGVRITGLMGMASFTDDMDQVRREFRGLTSLAAELKTEFFRNDPFFRELSFGMSGDYGIAVEEGSTIVRIGTKIFGIR